LKDGYSGAFSIEWERAWHPELEPAGIALPAALNHVRKILYTLQQTIERPPEHRSLQTEPGRTKQ
jgi:hypothetical protein